MKNNMTKQFSPSSESSSRPSCPSSIHRLTGSYFEEAYMWMYDFKIDEDAENDFKKVWNESSDVSEVL